MKRIKQIFVIIFAVFVVVGVSACSDDNKPKATNYDYSSDYRDGKNDGYNEGYNDGYRDGYADGLEEGRNTFDEYVELPDEIVEQYFD